MAQASDIMMYLLQAGAPPDALDRIIKVMEQSQNPQLEAGKAGFRGNTQALTAPGMKTLQRPRRRV